MMKTIYLLLISLLIFTGCDDAASDKGCTPKCETWENCSINLQGDQACILADGRCVEDFNCSGNSVNTLCDVEQHLCIKPPFSCDSCTGDQICNDAKDGCIFDCTICTGDQICNDTKDSCIFDCTICSNDQICNEAKTACIFDCDRCTGNYTCSSGKTKCVFSDQYYAQYPGIYQVNSYQVTETCSPDDLNEQNAPYQYVKATRDSFFGTPVIKLYYCNSISECNGDEFLLDSDTFIAPEFTEMNQENYPDETLYNGSSACISTGTDCSCTEMTGYVMADVIENNNTIMWQLQKMGVSGEREVGQCHLSTFSDETLTCEGITRYTATRVE